MADCVAFIIRPKSIDMLYKRLLESIPIRIEG